MQRTMMRRVRRTVAAGALCARCGEGQCDAPRAGQRHRSPVKNNGCCACMAALAVLFMCSSSSPQSSSFTYPGVCSWCSHQCSHRCSHGSNFAANQL